MPVWVRPIPAVMGLIVLANGILAPEQPQVASLLAFGVGWALLGVSVLTSGANSGPGHGQQSEASLTKGGSNA